MKTHVVVSGLLVLLLLSAAGGVAAWLIATRPEPKQEEPRRPVQTVLAPAVKAERDYRVQIVGYGSARPRVRLRIAPRVAGEVVAKAANFLSGERVRRGQVLCEIDQTDYVLARDSARRQIDLLEVRLKRLETEQANLEASREIERKRLALATEQLDKARQLLSRGAAGENDVDTAEEAMLLRKAQLQGILNQIALIEPQRKGLLAEIAVAKVQLAEAETAIARTRITSPVTGRVLSCSVEVGEHAAVGQVCGELYGTEVMDVPVPVPAGDLQWLDLPGGASSAPAGGSIPATVQWHQPDNGTDVTWPGRVDRIEAGLAAQTRTATIVVEVRNPPPDRGATLLDLNMFCKVTILGRTLPVAYVLSRAAILPDKKSVYVVNSGRLQRRGVKIARLAGEEALLLAGEGVEEGDRVILGYVPKPVLGMRLRAVDSLAEPATQAAGRPAAGPTTRP
jgi:multidrug efflux pump subunit AcrA (membrane-fusion protein)